MLLTLEIIVFTFGAVVTIVTALLKLVNYLADLRSLMISLRGEIEYIKEQQAQHREELFNLHNEVRATRSTYGHGQPYPQGDPYHASP